MKNMRPVVTILVFLAVLVGCQKAPTVPVADLVLTNAYVYTADTERRVAQSVAIQGNRIVHVGSGEEVKAYVGPDTEVRDLAGAMVMPGMHDMHIHALGVVKPGGCDLDSQPYSLGELVPVLQQCITDGQIPPGEWLLVQQWNFTAGNQPSEGLPNMRAALDAVSLDHPIFLWGNDGHHGAANSAALARAINPQGQMIALNAATIPAHFAEFRAMIAVDESGEPTGGINEEARALLRPDFLSDMLGVDRDPASFMPQVAAVLAERGITSIQDPYVTPGILAFYDWLESQGLMTFRLRAALSEPAVTREESIDAHLQALAELRSQHEGSGLIEANAVKLFADGVLEGNPLTSPPTMPVAAMIGGFKQPIFGGSLEHGTFDIQGYVDLEQEACQAVRADAEAYAQPEAIDAFHARHGFYPQQCIPYSGHLAREESYIRAYIRKATEAGFHVHVHALADQAVRTVVDEFSKVKEMADRSGVTQSLAHVQVVHPDDQKRMGKIGAAAVMTFVWVNSGPEYEMMVAPFIDELKGAADLYNPDHYYIQNVYPARSMQDAGVLIVNGSDAPVGSRDPMPLTSLQIAVTRGSGGYVLNEQQALDIHSAIAAFTINGARLRNHAADLGTIETGKIADLIVLDQNIVELAESGLADRIGETKVQLTVFDGRVVFERN